MTAHKHLKQRVRARMEKTGESYSSARRHLVAQPHSVPLDPAVQWHFPGSVPAATALRVLLAHAGVRAPHTGQPFSEAMLFGIAGGIGIGVFSFYYEKEAIATFFLGARHSWYDDLAYLENALARFDIQPRILESSGAKSAEKQLREALVNGPCIAWVDLAHLPHRALPAKWSGGGYHVVTVYKMLEDGDSLIGDLTDEPILISQADLAQARQRIKKQKNRLLSIGSASGLRSLAEFVRAGLHACHRGLIEGSMGGAKSNFRLQALRTWAERMHGAKDKDSWERVFAPGRRLWQGLTAIYLFIECYGTGGGLCRPLMAEFLREAAKALGDNKLAALAERYAQLGRNWTQLAEAALRDSVSLLREAKQTYARIAELTRQGSAAELRTAWARLEELEMSAGRDFPLPPADCESLRADLKRRILALYGAEVEAHQAMGQILP